VNSHVISAFPGFSFSQVEQRDVIAEDRDTKDERTRNGQRETVDHCEETKTDQARPQRLQTQSQAQQSDTQADR